MTIYLFKYLLFEIVYRLLVAVRFLHHPTGPFLAVTAKRSRPSLTPRPKSY